MNLQGIWVVCCSHLGSFIHLKSAPERVGSSADLGWALSCVWRWLAAAWSRMALPGTAGLSCAGSFILNLAGFVLVKSEFQEKEWKVFEPMLRTDSLSFFCILLAKANQRPAWIQRGEGIDSTSFGRRCKGHGPRKGDNLGHFCNQSPISGNWNLTNWRWRK